MKTQIEGATNSQMRLV